MNKLVLALIALTSITTCGCEVTNGKEENDPKPEKKVINTITCQVREGWVDFQTHQTIYSSYGGRNSVWRFATLDGKVRTFTNCYAVGE
jgi:hypothetical protein